MRKIIFIAFTVLLFSGCSSNDLQDYKNAISKTESIEKGKINIDIQTKLDYATEGLTQKQVRDLSYFDQIELAISAIYDSSSQEEKVIAKSYYNFGGMGFDSVFYMMGSDMYLKMPVIDGYISLDKEMLGSIENKSNIIDRDIMKKVWGPLSSKWNEILQEKDVFKGEKSYILTEEGQIKTKTYTIEASQKQLNQLAEEFLKTLEEEEIIEMLIDTNKDTQLFKDNEIDEQEILDNMNNYIYKMVLEEFKGKAYVDFDERLIKEEFYIRMSWKQPEKGMPKSMELTVTTEYLNLGKEQSFEFPAVSEDEWLNLEEIGEQVWNY